MNFRDIPMWTSTIRARARHLAAHAALALGQLLGAAVRAAMLGGALGSRLLRPVSALVDPGVGDVLPVPHTLSVFGVDIHVQVPPFTGADSDPATVWNFQGTSGI